MYFFFALSLVNTYFRVFVFKLLTKIALVLLVERYKRTMYEAMEERPEMVGFFQVTVMPNFGVALALTDVTTLGCRC